MLEKLPQLPIPIPVHSQQNIFSICCFTVVLTLALWINQHLLQPTSLPRHRPLDIQQAVAKCSSLKLAPGPSPGFFDREESDRYEPGTNSTLIKNAMIWTGRHNGTEIIRGHILLEKGIVKRIGEVPHDVVDSTRNLTVVDASGAWVTPGLVDIHSHAGLLSIPILRGANDVTSTRGPINPWLRSLDALNTHDEAFRLAVAGGVTSIQIAPGNENFIGAEMFVIKLRATSSRTPTSMLVEPIAKQHGSRDPTPGRWRYLKQTSGQTKAWENNRMDTAWGLRNAYHFASQVRRAQDIYCAKVEAGSWDSIEGDFPDDYQWQLLVDVLRGKAKVTVHCHEVVDLESLARLSNEFHIPIAVIEGASEAYLVPSLLNQTWEGPPVIIPSPTRHRLSRETYRGSEFAGRTLADAGIQIAMTSDHPDTNSRYLIHEAQQAHYFGLPPNLALMSVTVVPASAVGVSHRTGSLFEGADADVVLWDSHPLSLGATPINVWIDGVSQLSGKVFWKKDPTNEKWKTHPKVPNWDKERKETVKWEGLPPLYARKKTDRVVFVNVKEVLARSRNGGIKVEFPPPYPNDEVATVVVEQGSIACIGSALSCLGSTDVTGGIDLHGGSISPGLMTYGSTLGLEEIHEEPSTGDGYLYDAFDHNVPRILGDAGGVVRAVDALMFSTRNALAAYRSGVTLATSSLMRNVYSGGIPVIAGLSTTFRTGSAHAMEQGAIIQSVAAMHVAIGKPDPLTDRNGIAVSEQIAALRRLLMGWEDSHTETGHWFKQAAEGIVPLIVEVNSADIMGALLIMKAEVENQKGSIMRLVFSGAAEAHLLAREIGRADVGVILNPSSPFPVTWESRRVLAGLPLTNDTAVVTLLEHDVVVGFGVRNGWEARNARFDISRAALESRGRINAHQAYALACGNLERLLGVRSVDVETADLVAYDGGNVFQLSSKVVAVISPQRGYVDFMM